MVFCTIDTLVESGISNIMIISNKKHLFLYIETLSDSNIFGLALTYAIQDSLIGIDDARNIANDFINREDMCLVNGDTYA